MAAWAIQKRISDAGDLCQFSEDGYRYDAESGDEKQLVFLRDPE